MKTSEKKTIPPYQKTLLWIGGIAATIGSIFAISQIVSSTTAEKELAKTDGKKSEVPTPQTFDYKKYGITDEQWNQFDSTKQFSLISTQDETTITILITKYLKELEKTDSNSLTELLKDPIFKANWDNAQKHNEAEARLTIAKIYQKNQILTESELNSLKIATYFYFKKFPDSFSYEDQTSFMFFLTGNSVNYGTNSTKRYSQQKTQIHFLQAMQLVDSTMKTDLNFATLEIPKIVDQEAENAFGSN